MIKEKIKNTELQLVMEAGRILMESGAEVYRIEETMKWMAQSLGIRDFHGYVMNLGLAASGMMPDGELETRVITTNEINIDLQKTDCINSLSRSLEEEGSSLSQLRKQLQSIDQLGDFPAWMVSLADFLGAGGLSLALESQWLDAFSVWVAVLLAVLPFAWQLSNTFALAEYSFTEVLVQALAAAVGIVAFSVLYRVSVRYYKEIGLLGGLGCSICFWCIVVFGKVELFL